MKTPLFFALGAPTSVAKVGAKATLKKPPRHGEWVPVKHDGRSVEAYVAYPESKDKTAVIVVIHEIFGMSDWVQEVTDEFAAAGYIAIAPDLLSGAAPGGKGTAGFKSEEVGKAIRDLNADQITADLNAVADDALKLPAAQKKLFVTGFCYGGGQSFRFSTNRPDLAAAFVFYGGPPEKDAMGKIKAPVYGFYAGNDARIDATIPATVEQMKEAGKKYEPVTYDGAGHRVMRGGGAPPASRAELKTAE